MSRLAPTAQQVLLGTHFFPTLIGGAFIDALHLVFWLAAGVALAAAICAYVRGGRFVYDEATPAAAQPAEARELAPAR